MPRFFVDQNAIHGETIILDEENAKHLSFSLRAKAGDHIFVCDDTGQLYECEITRFDGKTVETRICSVQPSISEPPYEAVLCQSIPKGDKMDFIIQKAVELGVSRVIPVESQHCITKLKPETRAKKRERWQRIAEAAAKQCGRGKIPRVEEPIRFETLLHMAPAGCGYFCYENGGDSLKTILQQKCAGQYTGSVFYFLIGPEGGFSCEEALAAKQAGWRAISLGHRILRTETASLFFLSALSYEIELESDIRK
ncbi:MAG: 16S rRNA (uracil(1498)-N(3))-methyltransferase [Clostridiales bacterium]|nr:16S rRNA (uracil(1498)-N(3))-methyltransferase [Clostridiales bacterium]